MSFKSKQRAKHGHLFGDDPLSATLVSASDDPLFSPTKTSQSSRTNSPASSDPLSRNSSPISPLDTSSSTPIINRRTANTKTSGSIFGDIDVSKLGGSGNSNGLYNKRVGTTSLRSTATLRSSKQFDEDEEDLFGGGRVSRTRVVSKATSPTLSNTATLNKKSPQSNPTEPTLTLPTPRKAATPSPPPSISANVSQQPTVPIAASSTPSPPPIEEHKRPVVEEKPSSSFFASASRFFKSSSNGTSKVSSSSSSIASVNSSNVQQDEVPPSNPPKPSQPIQAQSQPQTQPQAQPQPQRSQQQQTSALLQPNNAASQPKTVERHAIEEEEKVEDEPEDLPIIEDEATRAFADDVFTFKAKTYQPDYAAISPDLSMDALRIDVPPHKRMLPSISTPTTSHADVDDPWFDGAAILPTSTTPIHSQKLPLTVNIEPSVSSPLQQHHQHKISVQDIEPQKRTAFADLISSWNTGQTNNAFETVPKADPEQFFSHVAEEQRDIGFAGITAETDGEDDFEHRRTRTISAVEIWDDDEGNPWN